MVKVTPTALCSELDPEYAQEVIDSVEQHFCDIEGIVDNFLKVHTTDLDVLTAHIKELISSKMDITDEELTKFIVEIPIALYFLAEGVEKLGVREDIINARRAKIYNEAFQEATGTIPDKETQALSASQQEQIIQEAYNRAYKIIKSKSVAGFELLNSLKRMLGNREQGRFKT